MSQKLYIDTINPDWSMAMTSIPESISYNLVLLNPFNETFSPIFSVGRYIVIYYVTHEDWGHDFMFMNHRLEFMDLKRNPALIQLLKKVPQFSNNEDQLTSFLEEYHAAYDSSKDVVELVLGAPTTDPFEAPVFN